MLAAQLMTNYQTNHDDYLLLCSINEHVEPTDEARLLARRRGLDVVTKVLATASAQLQRLAERASQCLRGVERKSAAESDAAHPANSRQTILRPVRQPNDNDPPFGNRVTPGYSVSKQIIRRLRPVECAAW